MTPEDQQTTDISTENNSQFEALLQYLKSSRGFDFTGYKRSSLLRRITKRMHIVEITDFSDYIDYLEVHPDEFPELFDTILINVTTFFRDRDTWDYIQSHLLPAIIESKGPTEPIRIWSAACASGEEPYSLAMAIAELVGPERFREQVKIYATDVDEDALGHARQAVYTARDVNDVPPKLLEKYFEHSDSRYSFRKDLRRSIIFGRHDLMQDAPISRIDLLLCRNALMYFNSEAQSRILKRFHFSLNDTGFLVVGKAEMLFSYSSLYAPNDMRRRVFKKLAQNGPRSQVSSATQPDKEDSDQLEKYIRLRDAAFDLGAEPQIVIDLNGHAVMINERARDLFNMGLKDLNTPLREMDLYNRFSELKARIQDAYDESHPAVIKETNWVLDSGEVRTLDIYIKPVRDTTFGSVQGVSLIFRDLTPTKRLQDKIETAHQELETAYEEVQSTNEELETTNEELQSTIEEFETTNEELQSTNEELETTNEELQSTNEELETINEELHSTNEEMQTINLELQVRTDEINKLNNFLGSIIASLRGGVVVVDTELRVQIWSKRAEDMWGLRDTEAQHKNFLNLDIGLPVEQLRHQMRQCLSGNVTVETSVTNAVNRRGKQITCKVTCMPLLHHSNAKIEGVILMMEELPLVQTS